MSDQPFIVEGDPPETSAYLLRRFRPTATFVVLALNTLIFLLMTLVDASSRPRLLDFLLRTLTGFSADPDLLLRFGACSGPLIRQGEHWRLVMPMFLHIGLLHFLMNNYALYILGILLERVYGYGRFAFIYVGAGIGSSLASMTFSQKISAGASGAIFGIAGAMLVTGFVHREAVPRRWGRAFGKGILLVIVLSLLFGYAFRNWVDNWGHLGGLASGILLALIIPPPSLDSVSGTSLEQQSLAVAVVPIAVVALAMAATATHYRPWTEVTRLLEEGRALHAEHQDSKALDRFQQAARLAPQDERPHEEIGAMYLDQKRPAEAIREFEAALGLSPDSPKARLGLVVAFRETGDLAKAQKLLETVVGKNPHTSEGQLALADLLAEQKLYPEAIEHYKQALRLQPDSAVAYNNLGWLYATCEDTRYRNPKAALEQAQRAVELTHGKQAEFLDTLAEAYYANRNFEDAVKAQTKTLELDPNDREYQDHMARYRKAAGV